MLLLDREGELNGSDFAPGLDGLPLYIQAILFSDFTDCRMDDLLPNLPNDLEIYLRSPAGTEMVLMSVATLPSRNVNYSYDDEASISYETGSSSGDHSTSVATYQFNARPPTALGVFDGENALGTWTVTMCDTLNPTLSGSFTKATLTIEEEIVSPPVDAPVMSLSCNASNLSGSWTTGNPSLATAGALTTQITTGANSGASWSGVSAGVMNTINAWSSTSVQGRASWQNVFYWDNAAEPGGEAASYDTSTGQITFSWPRPVTNPIIHLDRVGGNGGITPPSGTLYNYSNGMRFLPTDPGVTLVRVAGTSHFEVTTDYIQRTPFERMADGSTSESSTNSTLGTAAGTFGVLGTYSSLSFNAYGVGTEGSGADGIEIVMCIPQSDVSLSQSVSANVVDVGDTVTITLTVNNASGGDATTGLQVTDLLPAGLSFDSALASQGAYNDSTGVWSVGTVNGGGSATLTITATATGVGEYLNDAVITNSGLTDSDATDTSGIGVDDLSDGIADDDETQQTITVLGPPPFPEGPGIGSSVCSADPAGNAYADILMRWEHNDAGGTSPSISIDNTSIIQSGTDEAYTGLTAQINLNDLNIDRDSISVAYDAGKYVSYSFTTQNFSGQIAEIYGFGAASYNLGDPSDNQDTGAYKVAILIDDDPTFASPTVLTNETAFNDGDTSNADAVAAPQDFGSSVYNFAHYNGDNIVTIEPSTTYYVRVYPYADTKSGIDAGQPYSNIVLWDDFMLKGAVCSSAKDYGDAPASYLEAAHKIPETPTVYLGNVAPDKEYLIQHTANGGSDGAGDDFDGSDDEDAYETLPAIWTTQSQYRLQVDCSDQGAYVSGWIDFNQSGEFDASERNSDFPVQCNVNGTATLNWTGLSGLSPGTTYARLRIASDQIEVSTATGEASDGEVEDYPVILQNPGTPPPVCNGVTSWMNTTGQAADPNANWSIDWAERGLSADVTFNTTMTGTNAKWTAAAAKAFTQSTFSDRFGSPGYGINLNYPNDLSGAGSTTADIVFSEALPANTYMVVRDVDATNELVTFSNNNLGSLPAPSLWETQSPLTSNANSPSLFASWDSALQRIVTLSDGPNNDQEAYVWSVTGLTNLRVTYQTYAGSANVGFVSCIPQDHADAPDTYATYKASSGPQHGVINGVYLGSTTPDTENDGQPSATAANDGADEDGVSALSVLTTSDRTYNTTVKASNDTSDPATLIAWIDFDGNGTFDADEAAIRTVAAGSNQTNYTLNWSNIPADIAEGSTYLRLRLTTDSLNNREPGGAKIDGEVEDHPINITTAGVTVSGRVFRDVNVNAANDSGEVGVTQLPVVLYDTVNDTCVSTRTDGNGDYVFKDVTPGTYQVYEASRQKVPVPADCGPAFANNPASYRSTTADVRDAFTVTTSDITDQDFGEVKPPVFEPDNSGQVLPGNVLFYAHKFTTPTKGSVSFTSVSSGNISSGWSSILYRDTNCDGVLNGSEGAAPLANPVATSASSSVCLINKVYAPSNVAANDTYIQTITAAFDYENPYAGTQSLVVKDVTTSQQVQAPTLPATPEVVATPEVPAQPEQPATPATPYIPETDPEPAQAPVAATPVVEELGPSRLELRKTVRNITKNSAETATVSMAEPGDTLEYRIYYSNTGTGPITDLVVNDTVPPYTALLGSSSCGTEPSGMSCTASPLGLDDSLKWIFSGTLTGGSGSSVSYQVKIDE